MIIKYTTTITTNYKNNSNGEKEASSEKEA